MECTFVGATAVGRRKRSCEISKWVSACWGEGEIAMVGRVRGEFWWLVSKSVSLV